MPAGGLILLFKIKVQVKCEVLKKILQGASDMRNGLDRSSKPQQDVCAAIEWKEWGSVLLETLHLRTIFRLT